MPGRLDTFVLQRGDRVLHLVRIARTDCDVCAFRCQRVSDGAPDAAGAAQDDSVLALELKIHTFLHDV